MSTAKAKKHIAILGGGPSALFLYKRFIESKRENIVVEIFEAKQLLGYGMPYSDEGAGYEHITNVSGNEIPALVTPVIEWIKHLPDEALSIYDLDKDKLNDYKVLPRLLFGKYLNAQFEKLIEIGKSVGIVTQVHSSAFVTDVIDLPETSKVSVEVDGSEVYEFDSVIICTGHKWLLTNEGKLPGYFESPYPPGKLDKCFDHTIAIRGSSLTAVDAIRTLARANGRFINKGPHMLSFIPNKGSENFRIVMHSRQGLLPGIRFHLDDPHYSKNTILSKEDILKHMIDNDGFVSLDFIFEKNFKEPFRDKDPEFYDFIRDMKMEGFVETMMNMRERADAFQLFKSEYEEAALSIRRKESVYWKEMLAALSFALNYPAKHLSAEDMQRLQQVLMPLVSIVIAFVPQSSCEEMIALHEAGRLDIISVGDDSKVEIQTEGGIVYIYSDTEGQKKQVSYQSFIDCTGQSQLWLDDFPFKSLVNDKTVSAARLKFRDSDMAKTKNNKGNKNIEAGENNNFYLKVPGIAITDNFSVIEENLSVNARIHVMAVPYIGGYNPDYSGLDFCDEASKIIVEDILNG